MRGPRGFTLLEILVAIAIFAFIAAVAMATMANSGYLASSGLRARQLRMLAERKLGEILLHEAHYDDAPEPGTGFDTTEYGPDYADWQWQTEIRDVNVFGVSNQQDAQYLFGEPSEADKQAAQTTTGASASSGAQQKKGETQQVREIVLTVRAPSDSEGAQDSVQFVTFMPLVKAKAAPTK